MKLAISSLAVLSAVLSLACTSSLKRAADEGLSRQVKLEGVEGFCSGIILRTGKVLTAAHCTSEKLTADGKVAKVVKIDEKLDLLLLSAPTRSVSQVKYAEARVTQVVVNVSNFKDITNMTHVGRVTKFSDSIYHSIIGGPGSSGSGLYNENGQLVGMHHRSFGIMTPVGGAVIGGMAVPASVIQEFVGEEPPPKNVL